MSLTSRKGHALCADQSRAVVDSKGAKWVDPWSLSSSAVTRLSCFAVAQAPPFHQSSSCHNNKAPETVCLRFGLDSEF